MTLPNYSSRVKDFEISTRDEIQATLFSASESHPVIVMDVRTSEEITTDGRVHPHAAHTTWVHVADCTAEDCPSLRNAPNLYINDVMDPDKKPSIIIHCKSGRRANVARYILMEQGNRYGKILNAGGYVDIEDMID